MFPVIAVKSIVKSSKQKLNMIINKHSSSGCGGSPWRLRTFLPPTALAPPQPGDQWRILVRNRFPSTLLRSLSLLRDRRIFTTVTIICNNICLCKDIACNSRCLFSLQQKSTSLSHQSINANLLDHIKWE